MRVFTDLTELPAFRKAVVTIGSFDGVHAGHRRLLEKVQALARHNGGESIVITFDPHPRTVLQPNDPTFRLLTTTAEKLPLLAACGVDNVVVVPFDVHFARLTAREYVEDFLVAKFKPAHVIIGYDHRFGNNREGNLEFLKKYASPAGFVVDEIPAHEVDAIAVSSSKIRHALDATHIPHANQLLGYAFFFTGQVVHGQHIGRTIGFPTANIELSDPYKLILPAGIYAARVHFPAHPPQLEIPSAETNSASWTAQPPLPRRKGGVAPHPALPAPENDMGLSEKAQLDVLPPFTGGQGGAFSTGAQNADALPSLSTLEAPVTKNAMLYIGHRPTVGKFGSPVIEVNILDFEGDLYGQMLTVEVLDFIRPDRKLDGLEALQAQIKADKVEIEQRLAALVREKQGPSIENSPAPEAPPSSPTEGGDGIVENTSAQSSPTAQLEVLPPFTGGQEGAPLAAPISPSITKPATTVAIVILNYNTRRHLALYLPSVIAHSAGARIIVADNGSPDDSLAFLKAEFPTVEVLNLQRNYGFAQGYNEALRQVQADIYVILNSDVEVAPGWLEPVLAAMQRNPGMGIAQPKILAWNDQSRFEYAGAAGGWIDALGYPFCRGRIFSQSETDQGQYDQPQACFWAAGAALFIRAELYHAFGGFDGDYFAHNEEIDLCWRIKRAGYSVWCIPQSVVYHLGGGTLEYQSPHKVFLNFRNSLYTLLKNESAGKLVVLLPARFLLDGLAGARFAVKGQFRAIWAIARAHFSFYSTFSATLRKRRTVAEIIEKQRIGPESVAGIFSGSIVFTHYVRRVKEFSKLW